MSEVKPYIDQPTEVPEYPSSEPTLNAPLYERDVLSEACNALLEIQRRDGYWWYTLEANETIGAEFIFLMHFLEQVDPRTMNGICQRILDVQNDDGSWALFNEGPPDLSSTVECYFALKLAGMDINDQRMRRARDFILSRGGITKTRVFTRIHLAMFGLIPWSSCPEMPVEAMLLPTWFPINIYEFSSWARATIVPLLVFMTIKPVVELSNFTNLDELFVGPVDKAKWSFSTDKGLITWEYFFLYFDKVLKFIEKIPLKPLRKRAIDKCIEWTRTHVERTEDIYPALAYAALMFKSLGYSNDSPEIRKPFEALQRFQQCYATDDLPKLPDDSAETDAVLSGTTDRCVIHQQCCISPVWDTPWVMTALLESGVPDDSPALTKAARWLIARQITECHGDWAIKNMGAEPGGWSFEFENDYFPDVDDTIQVLNVLESVALPHQEKTEAIRRGYLWLLSMQNDDGGWAAFDRNNNLEVVNKIPFSDHGACLDPSSPDITGRAIELFGKRGYKAGDKPVRRAIDYIWHTQETSGCWWARWGINYVYGTWCVLTGLSQIGWDLSDERIRRAVGWLLATQRHDGGWGESPLGYEKKRYVPWHESVPSQTAWGLMGLVAAGEANSPAARRAVDWLTKRCVDGSWNEAAYTGTGFPGHFYIRYHGYRHYFPVLALARFRKAIS